MWTVQITEDRVEIGERFAVSFQRTLRIPDDGKTYPLPPTLGVFPVLRVSDYADRTPPAWRERGGVFIPMYQREAMWLNFEAASWKPNAVKIGVGGVNAVTGDRWSERLHDDPQDYLVCPTQPWLDGIKTGDGLVRQFVAMPLGEGYTIEAQLTGEERFGGLQVLVFDPRPGLFPDERPAGRKPFAGMFGPPLAFAAGPGPVQEMGMAAGGQMKQKIYPDPHGIGAWEQSDFGELFVHIVNSAQYEWITDRPPPPSPVDAATYTQHGFPWYELYDEGLGDLAPTESLRGVKSVIEMDDAKGVPPDERGDAVDIDPAQIKGIDPGKGDRPARK
jgi:hypothetical protein